MDTITLTIDGQQVEVQQGATLLEAARELGIEIPTLCYHPDLSLHGSCRVCVVEDVKSGRLLASCVAPVNNGMEISTNSSKARVARKTNVELLLANHPNDCLGCDRNGSCELQDITHDLGITRVDFEGEKRDLPVDASGPSLKREPNKCILCGRCVRVCEEVQGVSALEFTERGFNSIVSTGFDLPQSEVNCANCGQCATVCPTAAITEISEVDKVWAALEDDTKHVVVQTAPSIQSSLGEEFGMEPGTVVTGQMAAALRRLGFDKVFTTDFAADLTIMEEGNEFIQRFKGEKNLPHITSCCPGWVKFCEHNYPDLISHLSSAKSPMSMFSAISKSYYAEESEIDAKDIYTVAIMPCTAKKFEKDREELVGDTDAVLTTRELARMIKEMGIKFETLADEKYDEMLGAHTGAGTIFGTTGGVTEAALRTVKEELDGEPLGRLGLGFEGIQEASLEVAGQTVNVAIANGLANASKLLDEVRAGNSKYHFIEVMACPNGCVGGGGQPLPTSKEIKQKRALGLRSIDESDSIRKSHENPMIKKLYDDYLGEPLGGHSHHLLHTKYQKRDRN
ncbi:NAD(P)-dependent iron-only hydrogenase catalytic subunit [Orenia metallireducens]|jgi:iron-only hydrogenase group A|uniref:NADH-dependent [FeFe] hydrogenase, group A6 n=1 Tax=Orenia metallireducens TaxID=1413210 RepID=UPI000D059750|nr:NADH-dependent [FeFe] hydrogenase, group A6 [Orenia metallireducens]PRX32568.1 NAD(P)-dependent iron-only hydrogenase catalytic subunit [Orenia metallireducens]